MGWQSCTDKKQFYLVRFLTRSQKNMILIWIRHFRTIHRKSMICLSMEPNGREVKVHYKGQRGEGVYDVAFEGLIQQCRTQIPGDFF